MSDYVSCEVVDGVARLELQRDEKLNALTPGMLADIEHLVGDLESRDDVGVLIVAGRGRAFSVGADLTLFAQQTRESMRRIWVEAGHRTFARLATFSRPTLAVVDGPALGGGLELALACDIRLATPAATFGQPEVSVGTVPGWGGTARLINAIGSVRARQLILTGRPLDATTAASWGLVNEVAQPLDFAALVARYVHDLTTPAPLAQEVAKVVLGALDQELSASQALEMLAGSLLSTTKDLAEAMAAFVEKRPPRFTAR